MAFTSRLQSVLREAGAESTERRRPLCCSRAHAQLSHAARLGCSAVIVPRHLQWTQHTAADSGAYTDAWLSGEVQGFYPQLFCAVCSGLGLSRQPSVRPI